MMRRELATVVLFSVLASWVIGQESAEANAATLGAPGRFSFAAIERVKPANPSSLRFSCSTRRRGKLGVQCDQQLTRSSSLPVRVKRNGCGSIRLENSQSEPVTEWGPLKSTGGGTGIRNELSLRTRRREIAGSWHIRPRHNGAPG